MSDAVSFSLEQLEPSEPPPGDAAARLLAQAERDAAEVREQARAEGFEQGRAAGLDAGRAEIQAAAATLADAARGVGEIREQTVEAVEGDAIQLGLALAGKILPAALLARPEVVAYAVQGALRRVSGQRTLSVLVAPADFEIVRAALGEQQQPGMPEPFDLQADPRVQRGAIVRTTDGEIDAQVQTQLERAAEVAFAELSAAEARGGKRASRASVPASGTEQPDGRT